MFFRSHLSIKNELLFLGLFSSLLILAIFGFLMSTSLYSISKENSKKAVKETNLQVSVFTEGFFTESINTIEALADNNDIRNALEEAQHRERALAIYRNIAQANSNILYIYSGYRDGTLLINDYIPPAGFDSTERPWYIAARQNRPSVSTGVPYLEANSGEWVIAPSKVLLDDQGSVAGVIAIDFSIESIVGMLQQEQSFDSQRSYVMDQAGKIIIHSDQSLIGTYKTEIRNAVTGSHGEISYSLNDTKVWANYNTIDTTDWIIITAVNRRELLVPIWRNIAFSILGVMLLAAILGFLQSKVFGRRFAEPLKELGKRLAAITAGKSLDQSGYKYSNHEIARIAGDIEKLAEHSLQKKTNELKTIIESTDTGILGVNEKGETIYINSQLKEMLQISHDFAEAEGLNAFMERVSNRLPNPDSFLEKYRSLCNTDQYGTDTLYFKDGRVFELFTHPLFYEEQAVGRLWRLRDITRRIQDEQKIRAYTAELELKGIELEQLYRQLDEEIDKAWHIHERTLPTVLPRIEGVSLAAHYQPAQKLGGDFYNIITAGKKLILYLSDVSGHGLDGAVLSAFIKEAIDSYVSLRPGEIMPEKILGHLNRQYRNENYPDDYFICIFLVVLDLETMELSYAGAGFHEPPRIHTAAGERFYLKVKSPPIAAAIPDDLMDFTTHYVSLKGGTTMLFTTDGLTEQTALKESYGGKLDEVFFANSHLSAEEIVRVINEDFQHFTGDFQQWDDDITFLVLRVVPHE